jgi:hypothetical protein
MNLKSQLSLIKRFGMSIMASSFEGGGDFRTLMRHASYRMF